MSDTEQNWSNVGPIYGVPLIDSLPLGKGGMRQALPTRSDLECASRHYERVAAGYEVVLDHWRNDQGLVNVLADKLAEFTGRTVPHEIREAQKTVDAGEE